MNEPLLTVANADSDADIWMLHALAAHCVSSLSTTPGFLLRP